MRRWALPFILALGLVLRLYGFTFGLPNADHAYSYNPDEWTFLQSLSRMDPGELDFNPHYFFNPTFQVYIYGAVLFAAHAAGIVNVRGSEKFYFDHPEHVARMIAICRAYSLLLGLLTIWMIYLLARRLRFSRGASYLAALFLALHPSHVIQCHYMTVNVGLTFWVVLAFLAMESWVRRGGVRNLLWTGAAIGLATSTKYTGALLFPLAVLAGLIRWRGGWIAGRGNPDGVPFGRAAGETFLVVALGGLFFVLGTPYSVIAFREFTSGFTAMTGYFDATPATAESFWGPLWKALQVHLFANTPGLLIAAAAGLVLVVRRRPPFWAPVIAWVLVFVLVSVRAGSLASDGRFLPLFPFLGILGAAALAPIVARRSPAGWTAAAGVVLLLVFANVIYLGRFTGVMPQQAASTWSREHVAPGSKVHLTGTALFYSPDWPLREYLQEKNPGNYARKTDWTFVEGPYSEVKPLAPDVVFVSVRLPWEPSRMEWLSDPDYEVVAYFPGKVRPFGRPIQVWLDLFDVYIWALRRKHSAAGL